MLCGSGVTVTVYLPTLIRRTYCPCYRCASLAMITCWCQSSNF